MVSLANDTYQFETYKTVRFYFNKDRSDEQYLRIDFDVTSKNETSDTIINNADRDIDKITAGDTEEVEGGEISKWIKEAEYYIIQDDKMNILLDDITFDTDSWSSREYDLLLLEFKFDIQPPNESIALTPDYVKENLTRFQRVILPQMLRKIKAVYPKILSYLLYRNMAKDLGTENAVNFLNNFNKAVVKSLFEDGTQWYQPEEQYYTDELWLTYPTETISVSYDKRETKKQETETLKFEVGFDAEYEAVGYYNNEHELLFTITFTDGKDSARNYFEKVWRDDERIEGEEVFGGQKFNLGEGEFKWANYYFSDDMGEPLRLHYMFYSNYSGDIQFDDEDMKHFKQSVLKAIDDNWDTAFLPPMNYSLEDDDSPTMSKQFYPLFYQALRKRWFEKKDGEYYWGSHYVNIDRTFIYVLQVPVNDPCNVRKLRKYEPRELVKGKAQTSAITYTFKDDGKTFTVQYFHKHKEARVRFIECDDTSNKTCKNFGHFMWQRNDQKIIGHWTDDRIEIDLVYLGDAKQSGHCSKAVSYMLKVLLLESAKKKRYPFIGRVYISSNFPCSAVNCYTHAFINNGFKPTDGELDEFMSQSLDDIDDDGYTENGFDFTFEEFMSREQMVKFNALMKGRKNELRKKKKTKKKRKYSSWIANRTRSRTTRTTRSGRPYGRVNFKLSLKF